MESLSTISSTQAALIAANPVLKLGQVANESDSGLSKVGDGQTAYNGLGYSVVPEQYTVASGTDTYTATFQINSITALRAPFSLKVKFTNSNTGAATLNVNGLGAVSIKKDVSSALVAGDILASGIYELSYDGTNFQMLSPVGGSSFTTPTLAQVLAAGNATGANDIVVNQGRSIYSTNGTKSLYTTFNDTDYTVTANNTATSKNAILTVSSFDASVSLFSSDGVNGSVLANYVDYGLITSDKATYQGYKYSADFSANYTIRSLVDKGYVDGVAAGYVPTSRTLTINGSAQDLSANRAWTIAVTGTASRIAVSGGSGLTPTIDLIATAVSAGSYGSATQTGTFTVDAYGRLTAASNVTITPAASSITGGAALTKTDDTNVTLTLGGTPASALLAATSLTLGWTGQLGLTRGGTNASLTASNGGIIYSTASAMGVLSGTATANQVLLSGSSAAPAWSTATYPATITANQILYATGTNTVGSNSNLQFDGTGLGVGTAPLATAILAGLSSANNAVQTYIKNGTSGTAAYAGHSARNAADDLMQMAIASALYTTSGAFVASGGWLYSGGAGGLSILSANSSGVIRFYTGGSASGNERARLLSTGQFLINYTSQIASEQFGTRNDQNAGTYNSVCNNTSGTGAYAGIVTTNSSSLTTQTSIFSLSASYTTSGILVQDAGVLYCNKAAGLNAGTTSNTQFSGWTNNTKRWITPAAGGFVIGTAALNTTATDGFLYMPSCAGVATGTPTTQTGTVPTVIDTTNGKFGAYYGGAWHWATLT